MPCAPATPPAPCEAKPLVYLKAKARMDFYLKAKAEMDFYLKAKARMNLSLKAKTRIWLGLSYVGHIRSTAVPDPTKQSHRIPEEYDVHPGHWSRHLNFCRKEGCRVPWRRLQRPANPTQ